MNFSEPSIKIYQKNTLKLSKIIEKHVKSIKSWLRSDVMKSTTSPPICTS